MSKTWKTDPIKVKKVRERIGTRVYHDDGCEFADRPLFSTERVQEGTYQVRAEFVTVENAKGHRMGWRLDDIRNIPEGYFPVYMDYVSPTTRRRSFVYAHTYTKMVDVPVYGYVRHELPRTRCDVDETNGRCQYEVDWLKVKFPSYSDRVEKKLKYGSERSHVSRQLIDEARAFNSGCNIEDDDLVPFVGKQNPWQWD